MITLYNNRNLCVNREVPNFLEPKNRGEKNIELSENTKLYPLFVFGDLTENRTPIARMKTWCPNR
jgi:hypothetical protein